MKQLFENIVSLRTKIDNLLHSEVFNSHNKIEYHFHGPVNFIGKLPQKLKDGFQNKQEKN